MNDERSGCGAGLTRNPPSSEDFAALPAARPAASAGPLPLTHGEKRLIVISVMLPLFLGSVDQSILATALPTIGRDLGNVHDLPWLITAFLISTTALTPLYGKFADIHGRRAALLIGLAIYMAGALICAASSHMLMLIGGRIVQGCGAAGLINIGIMILGDIATPKDRGRYYAYFSLAFTSAGASGPALGGWISDHLHWSVIFLWNLPLCIMAVLLTLTVLRRLPRHERRHRLDIVGAALIMAASSAFMLALNLGGVRYPWLSAPVLALFAGSLLLGTGFVVRLLTAAEPLIPVAVLSDRSAQLAMIAHSFGWGALIGLNVFLPTYLQSALGWSATTSGLSLMTLMVALNASAGLSSQITGRVRHYKLLPLICLIIGIGAILALAASPAAPSALRLQIIFFLIGIGFGPTAPLTQVMLQNTVASRDLGAAVGTMNFLRTLVGTIVVAIFGAIILAGVPAAAPGGASDYSSLLRGVPAASFVNVFLATAGALAVAFAAMVLVEEKPLQDARSATPA